MAIETHPPEPLEPPTLEDSIQWKEALSSVVKQEAPTNSRGKYQAVATSLASLSLTAAQIKQKIKYNKSKQQISSFIPRDLVAVELGRMGVELAQHQTSQFYDFAKHCTKVKLHRHKFERVTSNILIENHNRHLLSQIAIHPQRRVTRCFLKVLSNVFL